MGRRFSVHRPSRMVSSHRDRECVWERWSPSLLQVYHFRLSRCQCALRRCCQSWGSRCTDGSIHHLCIWCLSWSTDSFPCRWKSHEPSSCCIRKYPVLRKKKDWNEIISVSLSLDRLTGIYRTWCGMVNRQSDPFGRFQLGRLSRSHRHSRSFVRVSLWIEWPVFCLRWRIHRISPRLHRNERLAKFEDLRGKTETSKCSFATCRDLPRSFFASP